MSPQLTIAQISDIHLGAGADRAQQEFYLANFRRVWKAVLAEKPDAVVFSGDMTDHGTEKELDLMKREIEGADILRRLKGRVILLDVKGRKVQSEDIATLIDTSALGGESELTFVIGGSNGVSAAVKQAAADVLSFGDITLPHQLFRVVLLEQLYRAETILHATPYHK